MPRRRKRRPPSKQSVGVQTWLVGFGVLAVCIALSAIVSVFESHPIVGTLLFIVTPLVVSVIWVSNAVRDKESRSQERIASAQDIAALLTGSGTDFELAVADVLRAHGYKVDHVGGSGDQGADLRGTNADGERVIVQCKRYGPDNKVGSPEIQRFMGAMVHHGADRGLFITTSTYTRQALAMSEGSPVAIELIDGQQFVQLAKAAH